MELLFWLCILTILYVYVGYPALLAVAGATRPTREPTEPASWPRVSLIVSAYNEVQVIREKLDNALALRYPAELLEVIVVSDCSDDGTDEVVDAVPDGRVKLLRMGQRSGKSAGLNAAVANSTGEILVFTDANAIFESDALEQLVRHFSDATVGVVTGAQRYFPTESASSDREGLYWRYELLIKRLESRAGSLVGGDGAIMAVRKALFTPLDASDLSDFLLPLRVVMSGYRNVYEAGAVCFEHATADASKEFERKVRIVNRAWRATMKVKAALNPLQHGWFAMQVLSHKVLRWLVGLFMGGALVSNLFLLEQGWPYTVSLVAQVVFYAAALLGRLDLGGYPSFIALPYYFCLVQLASLKGIVQNYRGETYTTWATARQPGAPHQ